MQKIVLKVNYEGIQIKDLAPIIHPNSRSNPLLVLSSQLSFILTSLVCVRAQLETRPVSCTTCSLFTAVPPSNQADAVSLNCGLGIQPHGQLSDLVRSFLLERDQMSQRSQKSRINGRLEKHGRFWPAQPAIPRSETGWRFYCSGFSNLLRFILFQLFKLLRYPSGRFTLDSNLFRRVDFSKQALNGSNKAWNISSFTLQACLSESVIGKTEHQDEIVIHSV